MYTADKACISKLRKASPPSFLVHKTRHSAQFAECIYRDINEAAREPVQKRRKQRRHSA